MFGNYFGATYFAPTYFGDGVEFSVLLVDSGRRPIGVAQQPGQGGLDFPLVQPSEDITQLLADAWLAYADNSNSYELPFRINWLYGFGSNVVAVPITPVNAHDIEIVDANGSVVFNSLAAGVVYNAWEWAGRLRIVEWVVGENVMRVVYHLGWEYEAGSMTYDQYIEPVSSDLDHRVVWHYPRRLTALRVGLTTVTDPTIRLQNGYNTDLQVEDPVTTDGERRTTTLVLNAAPGSGSVGKFGPGCDDSVFPPIRRINNISPNSRGEFTLDATGCYRIERPVLSVLTPGDVRDVQVQNHALKLSNDCGPCCECDDFIAVWEAIRRLRDRYAALIALAQSVRDQYHANRQRWIESQECRANDRLRLIVSPVCPDELGVAAGYCNNSDECLENLVIHISFQYLDQTADPCTKSEARCQEGITADTSPLAAVTTLPTASITCQSTFRQGNTNPDSNKGCSGGSSPDRREFYRMGGSWPHYWAQWDKVDPGAMASVTFRLVFSGVVSSDVVEVIADAYSVPGQLTIANGSPVPGYVPGSGPLSTPDSMHLVACPRFVSTGLNQSPCCDESSAAG